jgi:hypothetical protein
MSTPSISNAKPVLIDDDLDQILNITKNAKIFDQMAKERETGSMEGLLGRIESRSSLAHVSASADDILDKLKYINYQQEFCKPK